MNYDFNALLREQIILLKQDYEIDCDFIIESEQMFIKRDVLKPNTIYLLTRELQNDNSIGVKTQPIQVLILTEQDSLDKAKGFFSEYAKRFNFIEQTSTYLDSNNNSHSIWVKQQYSDPVVLSNFNTIDYGYRSVLYMSTTLYIMYDIVDLQTLTTGNISVDGNEYKALTFDLTYSMTPNTQQTSGTTEFISKSVKSISSLAINITIPSIASNLITKVLSIANESDTTTTDLTDTLSYGGNENFYFYFKLGAVQFGNSGDLSDTHKVLKMKLVSMQFGTAINNIPAIRLGFSK